VFRDDSEATLGLLGATNSKEVYNKAFHEMGIHGIITEFPGIAMSYVEQIKGE
jgi:hypothetical protein